MIDCPEEGCSAATKGYDIDKVYDSENCPIYAVYYKCGDGHEFICEYDRTAPLAMEPEPV
jgi:hypothetical protein